jgi:hypothetical protein
MVVENELKDFASELSERIAQHSTVPTVPVPECKEKKNWFSPALRIRIRIRTGSELIRVCVSKASRKGKMQNI